MMSKLMVVSAIGSILLFPGLAASAEQHQFVSMKEINAKGYPATLKGGEKVRIVKVENRASKEKDCRVDVNSLKVIRVGELKPVASGATAQLSLKSHVDADGAYCSGKGSGCVITVEIPVLRKPATKM